MILLGGGQASGPRWDKKNNKEINIEIIYTHVNTSSLTTHLHLISGFIFHALDLPWDKHQYWSWLTAGAEADIRDT